MEATSPGRRRARLAALALLLLAAAGAPLWGPPLLREVPWFGVRRVEVSGTRLLAPHEVLRAAGVHRAQSVWDDPAAWEAALRTHPVIAGARVTRKLPGTLRVRIEEKQPVAFVEAGALRPATAAGELLPLDPTRAALDLPIARGPWQGGAQQVRPLLAEIQRLAQLDPGLIAQVSEVRGAEDKARVLVLSHRVGEILLPLGAESDRLAELRAVLADLERRAAAAEGEGAARVDARYHDQIVVRLPSSVRQL